MKYILLYPSSTWLYSYIGYGPFDSEKEAFAYTKILEPRAWKRKQGQVVKLEKIGDESV